MSAYRMELGEGPLVVSIPHVGTLIPGEIAARMSDVGRGVPDTDWHLDQLYGFLGEMGVPHIASVFSRYVVDLNRAPDGTPLYPGARETELCPTTTFDDEPIYDPGEEPDETEIASRRREFWQPYHLALAHLLLRVKDRYGFVVLWDAHSIRARVPRFFDDRLPDLNLGNRDGASCAPELLKRIEGVAADAGHKAGYSHVTNGRFKGGFITQSYGRPEENAHAIQLELVQETYMDEAPPWRFREDRAQKVRPVLRQMVEAARDWAWEQVKG